jgi:hypothetical protein
MSDPTDQESRGRDVRSSDSAGAIYGTIAAMAVIAGGAHTVSTRKLLTVTFGTLCVFWLAHVYAHALAHHLRGARQLDWPAVRAAMAEQWPLITGPLPGLIFLALGALGVLGSDAALSLALWCGVAQLLGWGITIARRQRWGWGVALSAGVLNAVFGLAIVLLEVLIH